MPSDILTPSEITATEMAFFSDNAITFRGTKYTPDDSKGYLDFNISSMFPHGTTAYGTALYSDVIMKHFASMKDQPLDYEHQVKKYFDKPGEKNYVEDRFIGSIVDVEVPNMSGGSFKIGGDHTLAVHGLAVWWKAAQGMDRVVGSHMAGRHRYTVSMEVQYRLPESGFAVANGGGKALNSATPDEFGRGGYDYWTYAEAPDELRDTFDQKRNRITKDYKKRPVVLLMGGLTGPVHYCGVGLVKYGAERTATIGRVTASAEDSIVTPFSDAIEALADALSAGTVK